MTREQAWQLLSEHTQSDSLRKHALAVEAAMRFYAERFGDDVEKWGLAGLLHDFDYERWPNPPEHTRQGAAILRGMGMDEEIVAAILSHAEWNLADYPRSTPIRKTLFACDELCGFVIACALVRPDRLAGLTPRSVVKKLKTASFAAAVSRTDISEGAALLELGLDEHIANVIAALQRVAPRLALG
jgi:putative nucleotidyltransferase with HDIG domain